jgi:hypothetical protein
MHRIIPASRAFCLIVVVCTAISLESIAQQNSASPFPVGPINRGSSTSGEDGQFKFAPNVQALVDGASTVKPEFGADLLIRIAESNKVPNSLGKILLLTRAFQLATSIDNPVRRAGTFSSLANTSAGVVASSYRLDLSRLSLQSRAVGDLLTLDPVRATRLFEEIQVPTLSPVDCSEPLSYDLTLFYKTATQISRSGFTTKNKTEGRLVPFLERYVGQLQSHVQVKPAAQLLVNSDLTRRDLSELAPLFAASLSQLRGDERSFAIAAAASDKNAISTTVGALIGLLDKNDVSSAALVGALRKYLVTNFGGTICADAVARERNENLLPAEIELFNRDFKTNLQQDHMDPISKEELKNQSVGSKASVTLLWQSSGARQVSADLKKLYSGKPRASSANAEKETATWYSQLRDFLNEVRAWKADDSEPTVDAFNERSGIYEDLLDFVPPGPERDEVVDDFIRFLDQTSQSVGSMEWLRPADDVLSGFIAPDTDRKELVQVFANSGNQTLSLFAQLEQLEPRHTPPLWEVPAASRK